MAAPTQGFMPVFTPRHSSRHSGIRTAKRMVLPVSLLTSWTLVSGLIECAVNHGKGKINNHNNVHQTHIHLPGGSGAGGGGGHPYGGYGGPPPAYGPMPGGYPGYSHQPYNYGGHYHPMGGYPSHGYGADPSHGLHPNDSSYTSQHSGEPPAPGVPLRNASAQASQARCVLQPLW